MNVLILDHHYTPEEDRWAMIYIKGWTDYLEQSGHDVVTVRYLDDLMEHGKTVDDFDRAIIHPHMTDAAALYSTLQRRSEFKIILHSSGREDAIERFRESDQVLYLRVVMRDDIRKLLEE